MCIYTHKHTYVYTYIHVQQAIWCMLRGPSTSPHVSLPARLQRKGDIIGDTATTQILDQ